MVKPKPVPAHVKSSDLSVWGDKGRSTLTRIGFLAASGTGGVGLDHGSLNGLTPDDDHPQYILVDGTRAFTGNADLGSNDIANINEFTAVTGTVTTGLTIGTGSTHLFPTDIRTAKIQDGGTGGALVLADADGNSIMNVTPTGIELVQSNARIAIFSTGQHLVFGTSSEAAPAIRTSSGLNGLYFTSGGSPALGIAAGGGKAMEFNSALTDKIVVHENMDFQGTEDIVGVNELTAVTGTFTTGLTIGTGSTHLFPNEIRVNDLKVNTALTVFDGTAGSPGVKFTDDPDTGMFRSADDAIGFSAAGALRAAVTTSGVVLPQNHSFFTTNASGVQEDLQVNLGEVNSGANVGIGAGEVFKDKNGPQFRFRTLNASTNVTVTNQTDRVDIAVANSSWEGPAFLADTGGTTQAIPTGVATKVAFDTDRVDTDGDYNTITQRFVPSKAGLYFLHATVRYDNTLTATTPHRVMIRKNGTTVRFGPLMSPAGATGGGASVSTFETSDGSSTFFEVFVIHTKGSDATISGTQTETYFHGHFVQNS